MGPWATQTTTPSPQSPQAPANSLNHTKNLHLEFLGLTKDHTLTMWPTSTHKPPKPHQTPILWVLGSYEGPHLHCGTHKCPLTPLTTPDTYAVGPRAIQGTTSSPWRPKAPTNPLNTTRPLYHKSLGLMRGQTHTMKLTSASKPSKPHQTPTVLHRGSLGCTSDQNLTVDPTRAHKQHQTPTL